MYGFSDIKNVLDSSPGAAGAIRYKLHETPVTTFNKITQAIAFFIPCLLFVNTIGEG